MSREMAGGLCSPNDCIAAGSKSQGRDLLHAVDFHAAILAMVTHDLRQPLQAIISALELLARRITERPEREFLDRGAEASAQLTEKLEQLTDALHIYQHSGRIEPQPIQVDPILRRIGLQFAELAQRKGVDFLALPTHAVIMSQPVLLDGIVRNLARN